MEQDIDQGGVRHVSIHHAAVEGLHVVTAYIHHELTDERKAELAEMVERVIMRSITAWAAQ